MVQLRRNKAAQGLASESQAPSRPHPTATPQCRWPGPGSGKQAGEPLPGGRGGGKWANSLLICICPVLTSKRGGAKKGRGNAPPRLHSKSPLLFKSPAPTVNTITRGSVAGPYLIHPFLGAKTSSQISPYAEICTSCSAIRRRALPSCHLLTSPDLEIPPGVPA